MSSVTGFRIPLPAILALIALVAGFELWVAWLALHPQVSSDYRAYYIDQTTTCLNKPVSGLYTLGSTVSFMPDDQTGGAAIAGSAAGTGRLATAPTRSARCRGCISR